MKHNNEKRDYTNKYDFGILVCRTEFTKMCLTPT